MALETRSPKRLLIKNLIFKPIAFPNGGSLSDMDVTLGIVHFLFIGHSLAQLSQLGADGDGEGSDFFLLSIVARAY